MANLFSLKSLRNKPHRDGFDLSFNNTMTAPLGALLPCMFKDCMPGDKFKINTSWFTRSQPCTAPAYSKFTEYVDFFFVPYHFLWRYFPDFIAQANNNNFADNINTTSTPQFTQHPYFTNAGLQSYLAKLMQEYPVSGGTAHPSVSAYNLFGQVGGTARLYDIKRLYEYLGYGRINLSTNTSSPTFFLASSSYHTQTMNPFPLLAYNKIYNDFYRNAQWEKANPRNFNCDYLSPYGSSMEIDLSNMSYKTSDGLYLDNILDLKYCNYNKDMFTGVLPNKQFGSTAIASPLCESNGKPLSFYNLSDTTQGGTTRTRLLGVNSPISNGVINNVSQAASYPLAGISALAIRQAEFLQKWKEITQSGGTDYVSQMEKHFGVKPNSDIAHRCKYLGGITKNFGADEVVNTNLTADNEPNIMGKCVNVGNGNLEFSTNEHGLIMAIYHISLLPSYSDFGDDFLRKTMPTDYAIPEFDNLGMQPIYRRQLYSRNDGAGDTIVGYVPRYTEYKSSVDQVHGAFTDVYKNWVTPIESSFSSLSNKESVISYASLKVNPLTLNNLFNVVYNGSYSTDPFFVNLSFDIKAVRNISRDGLPW